MPAGLKSCVNRTLAPDSFAVRSASMGTVLPATGCLLSPMRSVAMAGPIVSIVAKVAVKGWFTAAFPARSCRWSAVAVYIAFACNGESGVKTRTKPLSPTLAIPETIPVGPCSVTTKFEPRIGSLNERRMTARGSICTALLLGLIETSRGGSWSAVVNDERNGAGMGLPTRSVGPAPLTPPVTSLRSPSITTT